MSSSSAARVASNDPVVLPLLLMHEDVTQAGGRHIVSVTVEVDSPSGVDRLWLHAHNLSYQNKASLRLNGGPWIDLNDATATCMRPEANYECIAGAYASIRLTVPVSGLLAGANTVEFSFNGSDGVSTGWRVLGFNFLPASYQGRGTAEEVALVGRITSEFVFDDPSTWQPPRPSAADVSAGAALFSARNRLVSEPRGPLLWAACSDCHSSDGRDLKYFNYSNESIIVRSKFHGMTEQEAEQVASFIRSLDLELPAGLTVRELGRPWNPPYQPGPGLDGRAEEQWAAGAGLEWVLEEDAASLGYMFPEGLTREAVSTEATLNLREVPVSIQFFDWNAWLPRTHPRDTYYGEEFEGSSAWLQYGGGTLESVAKGGALMAMRDEFLAFDNAVTDLRRSLDDTRDAVPKAVFVRGRNALQLWQLVKVWEVMQRYKLEGQTEALYGSAGEARSWFSKARNVFNIAPHIAGSAEPPQEACCAPYGSLLQNKVASHRWYHLQMVLNAGHRDIKSLAPMDWKYQFGHIGDATAYTEEPAALRLVATYLKMIQMMDNGRGISELGWYVRHMHPYRIFKGWDRSGKFGQVWSGVSEETQRVLSEVLLRSWLEETLEYEVEAWPRGEGHAEVEPSSYVPVAWKGSGEVFSEEQAYADNFYRVLQVGSRMGVSESLLDSLAGWGEQMWPLGDWDDVIEDNPPISPPTENSPPTAMFTYAVNEQTVVFIDQSSDSDGFVEERSWDFGEGATSMSTNPTHIYVVPGTYTVTLTVTDDEGATQAYSEDIIVVGVSEAIRQELTLSEGWNLVSTYIQPGNNALEAIFAEVASQIIVVKDEDGEIYIPEFHINDIGAWDPLQGYMIYAASTMTLSIEGEQLPPPSFPLTLDAGWNVVSYLPDQALAIAEALASISDVLVLAKDGAGDVYIPDFAINDIGSMVPGQGYKLYVEEDVTLTYPSASSASKTLGTTRVASATARPSVASSALVLVQAPALADGTEVVVLNTEGGVVGRGLVAKGRAPIIVLGDDELTKEVVEGAKKGEALRLRMGSVDLEEAGVQEVVVGSLRDGLSGQELEGGLHYEEDGYFLAEVADVPSSYELVQNYPNPFNPTTRIGYSLPQAEAVRVEIYNMLGQRVAILVDGEQEAGRYEITFDGAGLPSGLYVYRLRTEAAVLMRKMLLVK